MRFAGDASVKNGNAHDRFVIKNGHGDLPAEQFKFLLRLRVSARFVAVAAENSSEPRELAANAGIERQLKMFKQAVRDADAEAARKRRLSSGECVSVNGVQGRFKKIAARFTLSISRRKSKNCLSIGSALSECVRMDEKSRSTPSVCEAPVNRVETNSIGLEN